MTVEDLAEVVKSNKQTIYNKLYDESLGIPHWRMGKRYLFPTEGVAHYISAQLEA
jgi:excisionase family DNA binding protein